MTPHALVLVLAAALLHALWNIAAKRARHGAREGATGQGDQLAFQLLTALAVALLWAPAGLWVSVGELPRWGAEAWAVVLLSAAVHLAYFSALLTGYAKADLTVVYPLARGSGPLLSAFAAVLLLGERPGWLGWTGLAAIVLGVLLITGMLRRKPLTPAVAAGVRWGLLTGALIASYTVIDAWAIKRLQLHPLAFDYWCNLLRIPLLLPLVWRLAAPGSLVSGWRAERRAVLLIGACSPMAYILVLWALQTAPLSAVAPARECSMLFAALLGGQLLKEATARPGCLEPGPSRSGWPCWGLLRQAVLHEGLALVALQLLRLGVGVAGLHLVLLGALGGCAAPLPSADRQSFMKALRSSPFKALVLASALQVFIFSVCGLARATPAHRHRDRLNSRALMTLS
jgi:drug/metabolite transporter (DMT)-like permease